MDNVGEMGIGRRSLLMFLLSRWQHLSMLVGRIYSFFYLSWIWNDFFSSFCETKWQHVWSHYFAWLSDVQYTLPPSVLSFSVHVTWFCRDVAFRNRFIRFPEFSENSFSEKYIRERLTILALGFSLFLGFFLSFGRESTLLFCIATCLVTGHFSR